MTTIAALVDDGVVYMAADTQNVVYDRPIPDAAQKIHRLTTASRDEVLIGVCGDGALMVLIRSALHIDATPTGDDDPLPWADSIARALTDLALDAGVRNEDGRMDGTALLGWDGELWALTHHQAIPFSDGWAALGSGSDFAIGALAVLHGVSDHPANKVYRAVCIACDHDKHSGQPIQYMQLDPMSSS